MSKITTEFKLDLDLKEKVENVIKMYTNNENDKLEHKVYEYSFSLERALMNNQCFIVLNEKKADSFKNINIESADFWRNILPLVRINGGFIGTLDQSVLEYVISFIK